MVGAVIVKDGQIIGQGWHERYGQPHAERNALASCAVDPEGATMYVTLEPCCHFGKQPPCVNAILEAGISRVVVGSADPNPLVSGKGIAALRVQGVAVTEGVLREECDALNRIFFHFITTKRPFVSMKYAMTMDGKIATVTGASKWITSEAARAYVQQQRHRFSGIMVGVGTILADDPLLTCHIIVQMKHPVVFDLIFWPAVVATEGKIVLHLSTQHKMGILQGLIVQQPVQGLILARHIFAHFLHTGIAG